MLTGLDLYDGTKKQTSVIGKKANLKSQAMTWNRHTPNQSKNLKKTNLKDYRDLKISLQSLDYTWNN